jgi:predicted transcriptional regulator
LKTLAGFVKEKRRYVGITQKESADKSGVALTVIRKIEQGKVNLSLEKVNQVLRLFGHELVPVSSRDLADFKK